MTPDIPEVLAFEYEFIKKIGEGANGETWLVKNRINKTRAAVKCLKLNTVEDLKAVELFEREVQLLQSIRVSGVPAFYRYINDKASNRSYLVQEYIPAPSIQSMLDEHIIFSEAETLLVAIQLAQIIHQLQTSYSPPIIHRDIKPSNILYDRRLQSVYLIDFGSVTHPEKRSGGSTIAGSFGYMPPEQLIGDVDIQSDYYAIGATMLHMMTGVFPGTISSDVYQLEFDQVLNEKAPKTSRPMRSLLSSLLSADIDKRPPSAEALLQELYDVKEQSQANWLMRLIYRLRKRLLGKQPRNAQPESPQRPKQPVNTTASHIQSATENHIQNTENHENDYLPKSAQHRIIKLSKHVLTIQKLEQTNNRCTRCKFIMRKWVKCQGIIRNFFFTKVGKNNCKTLEYTFEAQNQTWVGLTYIRIPAGQVSFPVNCCVIYDPSDPCSSAIYSIDD